MIQNQEPKTTFNLSSLTVAPQLSFIKKAIYGSGDWGRASFNTLRQIFYAIFLTDVVGLDPRLASVAALISIIWDAINDPIVGSISDHTQTRWGRRRPFMLIFALPFIGAFLFLWWAPPWHSQFLLMLTVTAAFMLSDTIQTLITVPYLALTPEIAADYDERTSLTSFRYFFNLIASLVTAVAAPLILDAAMKGGSTQQQGYLVVAAIFGSLSAIPYLLIFIFIREQPRQEIQDPESINTSFTDNLREVWRNRPFRLATGMYVLNWIAFDIVALMLPYFMIYWMSNGNLLASVSIAGMKISVESVVLGVMFIVAIATLPLWEWLSRLYSKRVAYMIGMIFWVIIQFSILLLQPGQIGLMIGLAALVGVSVSNAHLMPDSILPDVIDWDELLTNKRREGMYYGAVNFIRKLSSALAIFIALQVLGWFGYQTPPDGVTQFLQPGTTLQAIRFVISPFTALLLISATIFAWFYPLSRERQARIRIMLNNRQKRFSLKRKAKNE
jgi:GPH family glycoside/pentoside/hexuronide:cation symporter